VSFPATISVTFLVTGYAGRKRMNLELTQTIAGIVGNISLVVTVIYLALQIRHGTRATLSQTYQSATHALGEMAAIVGETKAKARVFRLAWPSRANCSTTSTCNLPIWALAFFAAMRTCFSSTNRG
jgi:hypothetical protein